MRSPIGRHRSRRGVLLFTVLAGLSAVIVPLSAAGATPRHANYAPAKHDGLGIQPGRIKHVWFIILENKSFDATFTGLNNNTYLWKTLTGQGVLLKNYFGTGHFSLDNYIALASGQAPLVDTQSDCPYYTNTSGTVDMSGSLATNPNYGQFVSAAGPNAAAGTNGCVYPSSVPTLFNQLDSAGVKWKAYAQDLGNSDAAASGTLANPGTGQTHSAGLQYCGAPYAAPGTITTATNFPNPGSANATDQYVPKHFPLPWFNSILSSGDCNTTHVASLFDPSAGLYHDLQNEATTPAFSWISPNNCSDAHDAVCHGNNLSGGWANATTPNAPTNYTGGLYASDLFLEHVIPEIEASPAFKDGGLIDISFDEAFPAFTYTGNSFANSPTDPANASSSIAADTAGQTIFGKAVSTEPAGPNTPLASDANGNQLYPGPGYNAYVNRPANCVAQTVPSQPAGTCLLGGAGHSPGARTDAAAYAVAGSPAIEDNQIVATDFGRTVTGANIPAGAYVGTVTDIPAGAAVPSQSGGIVDTGSFDLVDVNGNPLLTTGPVSGITLGAETNATDPLYNATSATTGGGDTGSVLISPYITPGTVSTVSYNHYSWLRTMEDLFNVAPTSPGLDGLGHIGYAAQPGLAPFGPDVFNNVPGNDHGNGWSRDLPLGGFALGGGILTFGYRRRRHHIEH